MSLERVQVTAPGNKKNQAKQYTTREQSRHFYVVPDLFGVPGTINFRVIGDEYYAVVPEGTDPGRLRVATRILAVCDRPADGAIQSRYRRASRADQATACREGKAGVPVSPDVFLAVSRSLVAAADTRYEETRRLDKLSRDARSKIAAAKDDASRQAISKEFQARLRQFRTKVRRGWLNNTNAAQCSHSFLRTS